MAILLSYLGFPEFKFEEIVQVLICSREKIPQKWLTTSLRPDAIQAINLCRVWVRRLGPYLLSCTHRVQYGLLRPEELNRPDQENTALSRQLLAVPFTGKDTPSESSEFANADVLIGFTILAYRLEGMRIRDLKLTIDNLKAQLRLEQSRLQPAKSTSTPEDEQLLPAAETYCQWVELAGGRVKGIRKSRLNDESIRIDESVICVLPLETLDLNDDPTFKLVEQLLIGSKLAISYFLFNLAFPLTLKASPHQLVASGQHLGSYTLFNLKVGFSGTPSSLLPPEFGECQFEEGSDGQMFSMLASSEVTCCSELPIDWTPRKILEIATGLRACEGLPKQQYHALIDVGALVTGFSNFEASEIMNESLPPEFVGVMFFGDGDQKMLMNKNLGGLKNIVQQDNSDVIPSRRFTFYDHTHAYGQDVTQDPLAVALITLGKDTTFRDLAQGAWRLRQLGRGQRIHIVVPPEIMANTRRRRMLWKTKGEPNEIERAINWCLWNAEKQYKRLAQLTAKQSCEHLVASLILRTVLSMDSAQLLNGPVTPLTGRLGELCVEGSRNELPTILGGCATGWREAIRQLMQRHNDLWTNPTISSHIGLDALRTKADLIRTELEHLDNYKMQTLMKKESSKLATITTSKNALAAVFESRMSFLDDSDASSVSSFDDDNEQFDEEIEAEAGEEIEEEEEQEEEIEKEEEHEIITNDNAIIPGLKYSKSKEPLSHWTVFALRDSIARGRLVDPASHQVLFRSLSECALSSRSGQPLRVNLSPAVWCTQNFHPQAWDSSVRRVRNVLFVLEVSVTTANEEANADNSVTFQMLFQSFLSNSSQPLSNSQFFLLLSLLGILDTSDLNHFNLAFLAKLKAVINSLELEKHWTLKEAFRVLFMNYNLSLLGKYQSTTTSPVEVPTTSLFNKSIYHKFVCLTLKEAQMIRRFLQGATSKKFSLFSAMAVRLGLRSALSNFALLDHPALEYEEALSVHKSEAFSTLRFVSGLASLRQKEQAILADLLARSDEIILKLFLSENALRRRRLQLPDELVSSLASHLTDADFMSTSSLQESNHQMKLLAAFVKDRFHERSMTPQSFVQELIAITMKRTPLISPKAEDSSMLLEEAMPTEIDPSVGSVLIWLAMSGLPLSPRRLQNISILLRTAFNGSLVTVQGVEKFIAQGAP